MLPKLVRAVWRYLREVSGENDYARYCRGIRQQGTRPMTPQQFYVSELQRKYSRISRCC